VLLTPFYVAYKNLRRSLESPEMMDAGTLKTLSDDARGISDDLRNLRLGPPQENWHIGRDTYVQVQSARLSAIAAAAAVESSAASRHLTRWTMFLAFSTFMLGTATVALAIATAVR
jgi:hypothetical protein